MFVEILIGMTASGKSSYATKRAKAGAITINDDAIVKVLHGGDYLLYSKGLKPLYKHVEMAILSMAVSFGRPVVIDRPCLKKLTRARYIGIARSFDVPVRAVLFPMRTPSQHAQWRVDNDPRGHSYDQWLRVAEQQFEEYEAPSLDEGFENIVTPQQAMELAVG